MFIRILEIKFVKDIYGKKIIKKISKIIYCYICKCCEVYIAGCGGGGGDSFIWWKFYFSSSSSSSTPTYSGTVADGYISGATVCLDLDNNGTCGVNEPTGTTNSSGSYSISTTATIPAGTKIIAYGGTDTFTN